MSIFDDKEYMKNMLTSVESSTRGVVKVYGKTHPGSPTVVPAAEAAILAIYIENAFHELRERSDTIPDFDQFRNQLVQNLLDLVKEITPMNDLERLMAEFNAPDEVDGIEDEADAAPDFPPNEMPAPEDHPGFIRTTPSGAIVVSRDYAYPPHRPKG